MSAKKQKRSKESPTDFDLSLKAPISKSPVLNRSAHKHRRSPSVSSQRDTNTCRQVKFAAELTSLCQDLTTNSHKLNSCLEIYTILESNLQHQRCLQHNNTLSLYCLNERKILCVNCLYGMHRHRAHKVVPLKDCIKQVYEDNRQMKHLMEEQIKRLEFYTKISGQNVLILETEMRKVMAQIDREYHQKIDEIKMKHEEIRESVLQKFKPLIEKCSEAKRKLDDFRYKVWETFIRYNDQKVTDDSQIMKQLLFINMLELCEVSCRTITKTELEHLSRRPKLNL